MAARDDDVTEESALLMHADPRQQPDQRKIRNQGGYVTKMPEVYIFTYFYIF